MRVIKGLMFVLVATMMGAAMFGGAAVDVAMLFTDFSAALLGWCYGVSAVVSAALAGYFYFTEA